MDDASLTVGSRSRFEFGWPHGENKMNKNPYSRTMATTPTLSHTKFPSTTTTMSSWNVVANPFPIFFSNDGGISTRGGTSGSVNEVVHMSFPNTRMMLPTIFLGILGMITRIFLGANGGAVLSSLRATIGEVCRDYLNGWCGKNDCKHNHPPYNQLMAALSAGSTIGALRQKPMGPSAATIAAAQTIVTAQALQAHAASAHGLSAGKSPGSYHCLASDHFPFCHSGFEVLKAYCIVGFNLPDWAVMAISGC